MRWLRCLILPALLVPAGVVVSADSDEGDRILRLFHDEFVSLTPGQGKFPVSFALGSADEKAPAAEKPVVTVKFGYSFAVAKYEVTQELYAVVMGNNPSRWKGPRNSVEKVDHDEANQFCTKVTALLRKKKLLGEKEEVRLPSEAEWEYACRAGTQTRYSFGDREEDLKDYAWIRGNAAGNDPPVGKKKPNPWGLYDMHGYVWEWCSDAWQADLKGVPGDGSPRSKAGAKERVIRGGSWADPADSARSGYRGHAAATERKDSIGFRCVKAATGSR